MPRAREISIAEWNQVYFKGNAVSSPQSQWTSGSPHAIPFKINQAYLIYLWGIFCNILWNIERIPFCIKCQVILESWYADFNWNREKKSEPRTNETDTQRVKTRKRNKQVVSWFDIQYWVQENNRFHINTLVAIMESFIFLCFAKQFSPFISKMKAFLVILTLLSIQVYFFIY